VEANSTLKKNWILTPEAFAKLLAAFAPDSNEEAGAKYEAARIRLIKLFQWRGIFEAEEAADETLNRVARKIDEGEIVRDISAFIGGIARFVLLEKLKSKERTNVALEDAPPTAFVKQPEEFADDRADEQKLRCFNRCMREMPDEMRQIVVEYYNADADGSVRIEHRKRMAERLNLEMNALRNRALRARGKLEDCIKNCIDGKN
jgi:DNA-directed RNA polymerase specialized sigma24 family protein